MSKTARKPRPKKKIPDAAVETRARIASKGCRLNAETMIGLDAVRQVAIAEIQKAHPEGATQDRMVAPYISAGWEPETIRYLLAHWNHRKKS